MPIFKFIDQHENPYIKVPREHFEKHYDRIFNGAGSGIMECPACKMEKEKKKHNKYRFIREKCLEGRKNRIK